MTRTIWCQVVGLGDFNDKSEFLQCFLHFCPVVSLQLDFAFLYGSTAGADRFEIADQGVHVKTMGVQTVNDGHRLPISALVDSNRDTLLFPRDLFTGTDFFRKTTFWAYVTHLCSPSSCMIVRIRAMD